MIINGRHVWLAQAASFGFFLVLALMVFFAARGMDARAWQVFGIVFMVPPLAMIGFAIVAQGPALLRLAIAVPAAPYVVAALVMFFAPGETPRPSFVVAFVVVLVAGRMFRGFALRRLRRDAEALERY